jgi:hypothetical protein
MRSLLATALAVSLGSFAPAQVFELFAMTVPNTVIDMDNVGPAGATSVAAIAAAGNNGPAPIANIDLRPSTANPGVYDTNTGLGRALARGAAAGTLVLVDPSATFNAFDAVIDLSMPCTEIGIAVGDWLSTMDLEFSFRGVTIATHTSSAYSGPDVKFFRVLTSFDRVSVRASFPIGNWVIPQLHVQNEVTWQPFATGCTGSNGVPTLQLVSPPRLGTTYALDVLDVPTTPGLWAMVIGFEIDFAPGIGPLPFDLGPLGVTVSNGCIAKIQN